MGALAKIQEELRRTKAQDDNYFRDLLYFFEMIVPFSVGGTSRSFLMPLVLNPEEYSISEPYAVSTTPTAGGGLYGEEDGIIRRDIKISGHTGFKPRRYFGSNFGQLKTPEMGRSFPRTKSLANMVGIEGVSGHRHFQFLQDAFRVYADLKKDPATKKEVSMNWHVMKDDEHWRVLPQRFHLKRMKRVLYHYDIDLIAVGPAAVVSKSRPEDKDWLDAVKDAFRMIKSAVDTVTGLIQDVTGFVNDIKSVVSDIGKILSAVTGIIDAAADFVNGVADFIASPFNAVTSVLTSLDSALTKMSAAGDAFPDTVRNSFRQMQEAFHRTASHPEVFQHPPNSNLRLRLIQNNAELTTSRTQAELTAAAEAAPPNSFKALLASGSANTPGDLLKAKGELGIGRGLTQYRSAYDYQVAQGDSLPALAARELGDARKWRHLAILNGLKAPYFSEEGLPETKKIGDAILIPSTAPPPDLRVTTPVLGVAPEVDPKSRILGTDLAFERVDGPGNLYDIPVDVEGGSVDVKTVSGVANLAQAITTRLTIERGRSLLYQSLGLEPVVAIRIPGIDRELIRFRIAQAIEADPRIVAVRQVNLLETSSADAIEADVEAEVVGLTGPTTLRVGGVR